MSQQALAILNKLDIPNINCHRHQGAWIMYQQAVIDVEEAGYTYQQVPSPPPCIWQFHIPISKVEKIFKCEVYLWVSYNPHFNSRCINQLWFQVQSYMYQKALIHSVFTQMQDEVFSLNFLLKVSEVVLNSHMKHQSGLCQTGSLNWTIQSQTKLCIAK
jgi:hypothetical protein